MTRKELRKNARTALSGNWGLAAGVTLVAMLLGGVGSSSVEFNNESEQYISPELLMELMPFLLLGVLSALALSIFVSNVVGLGYNRFTLNVADGTSPVFGDLFSQFRGGNYLPAVKVQALRSLLVFAWTLLFIIPGIIAGYSYAMVPYIHLDHPELTASECLTASKRLMHGRKLDLFILHLSFFGWALLSVFTLGIGNLFLTPYQYTTEALFYRDITQGTTVTDYL